MIANPTTDQRLYRSRKSQLRWTTRLAICFLVILLAPKNSVIGKESATSEIIDTGEAVEMWYQVAIGEVPAGYMWIRELRKDDRLTTETKLELTLSRGGMEQSLGMASRFVESQDGQPIQAWGQQTMGPLPIETTYTFRAEDILINRKQGENKTQETLPLPADWTTPGQTQELILAALAAGAKELTLRSLDPLLGAEPVEIRWELERADAEVETGGQTYATTRWRQSQSVMPGVVSTVDIDAAGRMVRTRTPMMGLEMLITLTSREAALGETGAPELMIQSFVRPSRSIERPRQVRQGTYLLSLEEGPMPSLPALGDQHTEMAADKVKVRVELGSSPLLEEEGADPEAFLEASLFASYRSPELISLRQQATRGVPADPEARAEALRAFVHGYLDQKDLGSLFATASEAAANRSGDCTEHSVLLMALLRGEGIPARVVSGLVYADRFAGQSDIFGYHMWTQALMGGRWIDLDATLNQRFDATHIAFGASALNNEGDVALDFAEMLQVMGNLQVEVLEIGYEKADGP